MLLISRENTTPLGNRTIDSETEEDDKEEYMEGVGATTTCLYSVEVKATINKMNKLSQEQMRTTVMRLFLELMV